MRALRTGAPVTRESAVRVGGPVPSAPPVSAAARPPEVRRPSPLSLLRQPWKTGTIAREPGRASGEVPGHWTG